MDGDISITLQSMNDRFPFRMQQIKALSSLLAQHDLPSPPVVVVYGTEATGKTTITRELLQATETCFSWIPCTECVTTKHLLDVIATKFIESIKSRVDEDDDAASTRLSAARNRQDTVTVLHNTIEKYSRHCNFKHILVLDKVDRHREVSLTLLSGLARLGHIPNVCIVMIVNTPWIRFLNMTDPPYIHFPAYKKEECVKILSLRPRSIFGRQSAQDGVGHNDDDDDDDDESEEEYTEDMATEDRWLWSQCCSATWDTLGKYTARNIIELRDAADEIWEPLIQPILTNEFGTRDFSKLFNLLKNEKLRNREENFVNASVVHRPLQTTSSVASKTYDLPRFSKYLLCAAYLASYTQKKNDMRCFMKGGEAVKRQRKGGVRRVAKNRQLNRNHLGPQAFTLERMLAIFHSILPFQVSSSLDLGCQIATLSSLRLIMKASSASDLNGSMKWKVNVDLEYVQNLARSIKLDIGDYRVE